MKPISDDDVIAYMADKPVYAAMLNLACMLMDIDPEKDTPEGKFLDVLADAIIAYEVEKFPMILKVLK